MSRVLSKNLVRIKMSLVNTLLEEVDILLGNLGYREYRKILFRSKDLNKTLPSPQSPALESTHH